jgi:hypothetical protein
MTQKTVYLAGVAQVKLQYLVCQGGGEYFVAIDGENPRWDGVLRGKVLHRSKSHKGVLHDAHVRKASGNGHGVVRGAVVQYNYLGKALQRVQAGR